MKNQACATSIVIGKKPKQNRILALIMGVLSGAFSILIVRLVLDALQLSVPLFLQVVIVGLFWVLNFLLMFSASSLSFGYWEIRDGNLCLVDMTEYHHQFQMLANILLHTKYDLLSFQISLDAIEQIDLYAIVEEYRMARMYGDPGWHLKLKFWLRDGTMFQMPYVLEYKNTRLVEALDYMQKRGIILNDEQNLLPVMREKRSISEYLNGEVS